MACPCVFASTPQNDISFLQVQQAYAAFGGDHHPGEIRFLENFAFRESFVQAVAWSGQWPFIPHFHVTQGKARQQPRGESAATQFFSNLPMLNVDR